MTENETVLVAEVIEPLWGMWQEGDSKVIGHIRTKTGYREGARISEGELSIYHGRYAGNYLVLAEDSRHVEGHHMERPRT